MDEGLRQERQKNGTKTARNGTVMVIRLASNEESDVFMTIIKNAILFSLMVQ